MNTHQKKILCIVPARYASTRFPGKPLTDIAGVSMIRRVYEQAKKSKSVDQVIVATDHQSVFDHVTAFGGTVAMTSAQHASGTDRCFEVLSKKTEKFDYIINVQGDEPFIAPEQIDLLSSLLDGKTELGTLIKKITDQEQLFNPNIVKVIADKNEAAIYFSRATLPYLRNLDPSRWLTHHSFFKHIGMYAYRADILQEITQLPPSSLENAELLEQLRWIENGYKIKVAETTLETIGIDTPEDKVRAIEYLNSKK